MATELGTYYVSLVPSAVNITGHAQKIFSPVQGVADHAGSESGGRFSGAFGRAVSGVGNALATALKVGTTAATAAVVAAGGVGIKTAASLETAQIAFTTMLGSGEKAQKFLTDLRNFAAKTPFDLPGLQTASQSLISIGLESDKVIPIMTTLGNVTSGMGTGAEGIKRATTALQQMNAAQKISAEDLNQLRDAGIPVYELLTAATGKTTAEISEMRDKGELGREELELLMDALETGRGFERFNGLMEQQSQSLTGLWETLKDTFSVGMADIVAPVLPILKDGLGGAITFLEETVIPKGTYALSEFVGGITAFGAAWAYNDGEVTSSGFPGFMERVAYWLHQTVDWIQALDFSSLQGFFDSLNIGALAPAFSSMGDSLQQLGPAFMAFATGVSEATPDILTTGVELLAGALGFLAEHTDWIVEHIPLLVGLFIAWKVAQMGVNVVTAASIPLMTAANIARAVAAVAEWKLVRAQHAATAAGVQLTTVQNVSLITRIKDTVALVAHKTATLAAAAASKVAAGAQWLFNAAMSANPIAIVIKVVAALVGALVWFFTQTELGKDIWAGAMDAIGGAVSWLWESIISPVFGWISEKVGGFFNWVGSVLFPGFQTATAGIGGAATGLWEQYIAPAFAGIQAVVAAVWGWITGTAVPVFQAAIGVIGDVAVHLWQNYIGPAFHNIGVIIGGVWDFIHGIFQIWVAVLTHIVIPAIQWLWTGVVKPAFQGIGDFIGWVWNHLIVPIFNAITDFIFGALAGAFNWFWHDLIVPVWEGITSVITWAWENIIRPTFDAVMGFITGTLGPVWQWLGDKVKAGWDFLSGAISGVWNWLRDTIFTPLMDFIETKVVDAFERGVEGIRVAWDLVKSIAKMPVEFVINKVINEGIIGTFNKVADLLPGVDKLGPVAMPAGWAEGGVLPGYRARKIDDVLYPMRSGEGVLVPEAVRGIGAAAVHALNRAGNNGGVAAVRALVANQGYALGGLIRPIDAPIISGYRGPGRPDHDGLDFAAPMGAPVRAAGDGLVVDAGWHPWGGGNHIDIQHAGNLRTEYYHLSRILTGFGQQVRKGQAIGNVGSTGNSTGPHLHYEVHVGDALHMGDGVNPMPYLTGGGEYDPNGIMNNSGGGGGGGWINPLNAVVDGIADLVKTAFPGGGIMVDAGIGVGKKIGGDFIDWVGSLFGGDGGAGALYDAGGWLPTGQSLVNNERGTPEAILTDQQWGAMFEIAQQADGHGDIYVQSPFTAEYLIAETEKYAVDATGDAMEGSLTRARRGGKYASRGRQ